MGSGSQDKIIKIKIDTDAPSAQRFNATINGMNAACEKLLHTLEKVTRSLEGFQKAQGKTGGNVGKTPTGKQGGIAETILGGGDGAGVRNAAKATENALNQAGSNIKRFVDNAVRDMARLRQATGTVSGGYTMGPNFSSTGGMPGGGGFGGGGFGGGGGRYGDYGTFEREMAGVSPPGSPSRPGGFWTGRRPFLHPFTVLDENAPSPFWGEGGMKKYMVGRGEALGRTLGMPTPAVGFLGRAAGALSPIAGGLLIGGALIKGYDKLMTNFEDTRAAQVQYTLDAPFIKKQAAGAVASVGQRLYQSASNRDIASLMGYQATLGNKEIMKSLGSNVLNMELINNLVGKEGGSLRNVWARFTDWAGQKASNVTLDMVNQFAGGLDPATRDSLLTMAVKTASMNLVGEQANKFNEVWSHNISLGDPMRNSVTNRIAGDPLGRVKQMRGAGHGSGRDKKGNLIYEKVLSQLLPGGWDWGDLASAHQGFLGIGAGYERIKGLGLRALVGDPQAGLTNVGQLIQMGGMLGGSAQSGKTFYDLVQGSIDRRRGYLDVAVANNYFANTASSLMASGQFGAGNNAAFTYMGLGAGLIAGGGLDVAQQQRRAELLGVGNNVFASFTGGQHAPLYAATSILGAINASGGYSMGAEALSRMRPELLTSIARGGQIPLAWKDLVTQGSAQKFLNYQRRSLFFEPLDERFSGSKAALLKQIRGAEDAGGSWINVLNDRTRGLTGKQKHLAGNGVLQEMSGIVALATGMSATEAEAALLAQLPQEMGWARPLTRGHGAHAAAPRGEEKVALEARAKQSLAESALPSTWEDMNGHLQHMDDNIKKMVEFMSTGQIIVTNAKHTERAADNPQNNVGAFSDALPQANPKDEAIREANIWLNQKHPGVHSIRVR